MIYIYTFQDIDYIKRHWLNNETCDELNRDYRLMAWHTNDIHVRHPLDKLKTLNFNYNINSKNIKKFHTK